MRYQESIEQNYALYLTIAATMLVLFLPDLHVGLSYLMSVITCHPAARNSSL
jgi:hypothetical protein